VKCSGVLTFENVCFLVVGEVDCGMLRIFWCRALVTCICIHTDTDTDTRTHKHTHTHKHTQTHTHTHTNTHTHTHTHIASCCSSFDSCAAIALHVLRVRGETEPLENGCGVGRQDARGRECAGGGGGGSVDGI
jgi:hypothetical protein